LADEFRLKFLSNRLNDPLVNLPEILDSAGVILGRLETSKFEGASVVAQGHPFIFVSARFSGRMLFTLAHELGHLITHHNDASYAIFDRARGREELGQKLSDRIV
jgi:Zn-dependent peptidase ImmA (M78 family)